MGKRAPKVLTKTGYDPADTRWSESLDDSGTPPPFAYVVVWPLEVTPSFFVSDGKGRGRAEYYAGGRYLQQRLTFSHTNEGWHFFTEDGTTRLWAFSVDPLPATGSPQVWGVDYQNGGGKWLDQPQNARKVGPEDFGL